MKKLILTALISIFLTSAHAATEPVKSITPQPLAYQMSAESGQVQFKTIGRPSALKIVGKGPAPKGQLNIDQNGNIKGQFDFELATLDTGIGLRDRHMKNKYLEVGKFPKAAITIQEMKFPNELLAKDGQKFIHIQASFIYCNV